jgi:hypothetical protein
MSMIWKGESRPSKPNSVSGSAWQINGDESAAPAARIPEPNTRPVPAAGVPGALTRSRREQHGYEGVPSNG